MNDNSLTKLLEEVEPRIQNIEENRIELKALGDVRRTIQELMDLSRNNSYEEILNFYDQEFIYRAIKIKNDKSKELIDKYHSSKYLLQNKNPDLKGFPQYQEALNYMNFLYEYLLGLSKDINLDFKRKSQNLEIQELLNKYYYILNQNEIFVKNIDEFLTFIKLCDVSLQDKLNIYIKINKANLKQYTKSIKIKLNENIELEDVVELLNKNKEMLQQEYFFNEDLKKKLSEYLEELSEIKEESLKNRKVYLIHKIKDYYDAKKYIEITEFYQEFLKLNELEQEFEKQKKIPRELLFVFKNDKSLVREFLNQTEPKYKNCVLKNLLDIETENILSIPKKKYANIFLYQKDEFVVKTVYTYLEKGKVLILGVLDKGEKLEDFLLKNDVLYKEIFNSIDTIDLINDERDLLLKNIKLEDLMLNIDLETLDIKMEEKNAK